MPMAATSDQALIVRTPVEERSGAELPDQDARGVRRRPMDAPRPITVLPSAAGSVVMPRLR